jgi:putative FmdB family regulatory protein
MPIYEYCCEECQHIFEEWQKDFSERKMTCPVCGAQAKRLISNTAFILKGSGWYVTDYARNSGNGGNGNGKTAHAKDSTSSEKTETTKTESSQKTDSEKPKTQPVSDTSTSKDSGGANQSTAQSGSK